MGNKGLIVVAIFIVFITALIVFLNNTPNTYAQLVSLQTDFTKQCRSEDGTLVLIKGEEKCFCRVARNFFDPYKSNCPYNPATLNKPPSVIVARYIQCMANSSYNLRGCLGIEKGSKKRCEGEFLFNYEICRNSVLRNQCPVLQRYPFRSLVAIPSCSEDFIASYGFALSPFEEIGRCFIRAENSIEESLCDNAFMDLMERYYQEFAECYAEKYNIPAI